MSQTEEPRVGQVVYVYSRQALRAGRVVSWRGTKGEVEHADGERSDYPAKRIAHRSGHSVASADALKVWEDLVGSMQADLDLEALWTLLTSEERTSPQTVSALAEIALPAGDASEDAVIRALFEDTTYFKVRKDGRYAPNAARQVSDRRREVDEREREAREYQRLVTWLTQRSGPVAQQDLPPEGARVIEALERVGLFEEVTGEGKLGRQLLKDVFPGEAEEDRWLAWRVLRELGHWSEHENLGVHRAGIPYQWEPDVLAEARALAARPIPMANREDLRDITCLAIDDRFTTEVDDALGVELKAGGDGYTVYVFIADVSAFVPRGSLVDQAARHRSATVYLPEGKIPMLPSEICDEAASLVPGVDRPAMAFVFHLGLDWSIQDFSVDLAVIRAVQRVTYEEADAVLEGTADHPEAERIRLLAEAADTLRMARMRGGSITLDRQELTVKAVAAGRGFRDSAEGRAGGQVELERYRTDDPSRRLVSEWMIRACEQGAGWCRDRGVPTLYRTQEAPDPRPVFPIDRPMEPHEVQQVMRHMRRAVLSTEPDSHAGLGVQSYSQITSPLRRYADLVQHRQIASTLTRDGGAYSTDELHSMFEHLTEMRGVIGRIEREGRRYWVLKSLEPRVGEQVDVEFVRRTGNRWLVEVIGYGLITLHKDTSGRRLGEHITLKIAAVDARRDVFKLST
ncbi:MAG: exoribonuclease-2 [Myxococcota bacterium]|jgi:exoribonuclease-2